MNYVTLQDPLEIQAFADLVAREKITSYLEIGSKFGGSLHRVGEVLQPGSRVVAVDLPGGTKVWKESEASLKKCVLELCEKGHDARIIWGNSQDKNVVEQVRKYAPFDLILIDGDHRLPGVTQDWNNYAVMGKRIAFHDIGWRRAPEWQGTPINVPEFWDSVKGQYRHEEIKLCPTGKNNGIGVLWRE
jgi:methyltransferase family protein